MTPCPMWRSGKSSRRNLATADDYVIVNDFRPALENRGDLLVGEGNP
jgi:hypothetical protein